MTAQYSALANFPCWVAKQIILNSALCCFWCTLLNRASLDSLQDTTQCCNLVHSLHYSWAEWLAFPQTARPWEIIALLLWDTKSLFSKMLQGRKGWRKVKVEGEGSRYMHLLPVYFWKYSCRIPVSLVICVASRCLLPS